MMIRCLSWTVLVVLVFFKDGFGQEIAYFNKQAAYREAVVVNEFVTDFGDSTGTGTLYQHLSKDGVPVSYSRHIRTSVCFDGKCRLLDATLYWTATGGYMGFELPPGEFLSKTDHDPFSADEYLKLHQILSDSLSPLADYTFEELVPGTGNPDEVDAVSSATLRDILDYIVPGAAYTTYSLWHLVYGKTAELVSAHSDGLFSGQFALVLLSRENPAGQIWALHRLPRLENWGDSLTRKVLELAGSPYLNVAVSAVMSLSGTALNRPEVQEALLHQAAQGDYSIKKTAILKLKEADRLIPAIGTGLLDLVHHLNGDLLGEVLNVFLRHGMTGADVQRRVSEILEEDNRYKAGKAFDFLEKISVDDEIARKRIVLYRQNR